MNFISGFTTACFLAMAFWLYGLEPLIHLLVGMFMGGLLTVRYFIHKSRIKN